MWLNLGALALAGALLQEAAGVPAREDPQLQRIRKALSTPSALVIPRLEPTYRVEVEGKLMLKRPPAPADYRGGPVPPGGLYAFQLRQQLGNPWVGQPLVKFDVLPLTRRAVRALQEKRSANDAAAAKADVSRALASFCVLNDCTRVSPPPR